ncbi:MAG: hypothetical protein M3Q81_02140 [bacterium]|nr:hypothetical protein [bacterium]
MLKKLSKCFYLLLAFFLATSVFFTPKIFAAADDIPGGRRCPGGTRFFDEQGVRGGTEDPNDPNYKYRCVSIGSSIPQVQKRNEGITAAQEGNTNLDYTSSKIFEGILTEMGCKLEPKSINCLDDVDADGATMETSSAGGAYGSLVGFIGTMYDTPPASAQTYVADVMQDLRIGVAQPAYAQGLGFSALNPILSVWKIMRNLAYFFFILLFVIIGFMIMFRQKISSQAVVTAQQAIPSIIIALLAVTFSYAIAGLMIDAMYLVMFLLAGLFGKVDLIDGNVFQIAGRLIQMNVAGDAGNRIGIFIDQAMGGGVVGALGKVFTTISAAVIILLVIVFNTFKLFFNLLKVYIEIILSIAFAPVILMTGAIPGKSALGGWIKNLVGNLAVFPAILLVLIIFDVIRESSSAVTGGFQPPYLAGFTDADTIPFLAGLALILALPNLVDEVKKAFGVSQGGMFGSLIQAGIDNTKPYRGIGNGIAAGALIGAPALAALGGYFGSRGRLGGPGGLAGGARGAAVGMAAGLVGVPAAVALGRPIAGLAGRAANIMQAAPAVATGAAVFGPQLRTLLTRNQSVGPGAVPPPAAALPFDPLTPTNNRPPTGGGNVPQTPLTRRAAAPPAGQPPAAPPVGGLGGNNPRPPGP